MTNDWFNLLFGALAVIAFMGAVFALAGVAFLGRLRRGSGQVGSNDKINRLYLASRFLAVAAVICLATFATTRSERAYMAVMGLFLLLAAWRRSHATDAGDMLAPVFGPPEKNAAGMRNKTTAP